MPLFERFHNGLLYFRVGGKDLHVCQVPIFIDDAVQVGERSLLIKRHLEVHFNVHGATVAACGLELPFRNGSYGFGIQLVV
jgi:hypothetical protein